MVLYESKGVGSTAKYIYTPDFSTLKLSDTVFQTHYVQENFLQHFKLLWQII